MSEICRPLLQEKNPITYLDFLCNHKPRTKSSVLEKYYQILLHEHLKAAMHYIGDMENLFEWFVQEFVLFHCSSGNQGGELYFSIIVKVEPCAVASLLVFRGNNFGCEVLISFQVGMLMLFDSAPDSIEKSISRFGVWNSLLF